MAKKSVIDEAIDPDLAEDLEIDTTDEDNALILKEANDLIKEYRDSWQDIYDLYRKDMWFYSGNSDNRRQWEESDMRSRTQFGRPTLTINRLPQFVHQVMNDIRQNSPSIKVLPVDGESDIQTAEMLQDLVRNIEKVSKADEAYDTAAECAIKGSIGFIKVDHDYTAPDSFEQHILIRKVNDPMSILIDPSFMESGAADGKAGFEMVLMHKSEFKAKYPDAKADNFDTTWVTKNAQSFLCAENYVVLCDFYRQEQEEKEIYLLATGEVILADEYDKIDSQPEILKTRTISKNKVCKYKLSAADVLESTIFPSSYIPLVPVFGEENWVDGRRELYSLIRGAKDSQRLFNVWKSMETELLMKAPKAPWLAEEGTTEDYDQEWKDPDNAKVLHYRKTDLSGQPANIPTRVDLPQIPTGIVNAAQGTVEDMKATMGIYDPSLGARSAEKSGRAIIATQKQGDIATYHFADNLARSVSHVGTIIVDMIPRIYDTPRIVRTLGEDGVPKSVAINGAQPPVNDKGIPAHEAIFDLSVGKYDVAVTTGTSYATKRQESAEAIQQLAQAMPILGQVAPDLMVAALDFPGAEAIAARLKKALPPQFQDEEEQGETPDLRPQLQHAEEMMHMASDKIQELQGKIAQMSQDNMTEQQKNQLTAMTNELKAKELALKDRQLELDAYKLQIEEQKVAADREKTQVQGQTEQVKTLADLEKHKTDSDAATKQIEVANPNYINPDMMSIHQNTDQNISVLADAISQLSQNVAGIGQAQVAIASEIANKPTKVVAKRTPDGQLYAEAVH